MVMEEAGCVGKGAYDARASRSNRQTKRERRSLIQFTHNANLAAMKFDYSFGNCQTQAGIPMLCIPALIKLIEAVENPRKFLLGNTRTLSKGENPNFEELLRHRTNLARTRSIYKGFYNLSTPKFKAVTGFLPFLSGFLLSHWVGE